MDRSNKQTSKFDDCRLFLASLISRHETEITVISDKVKMYRLLDSILKMKSTGKKIPVSSYEALSRLDCPYVSFMNLFTGNVIFEPDGVSLPDNEDEMLDNCPNIGCSECWKTYIDELVELINSSEICIKVPEGYDDN